MAEQYYVESVEHFQDLLPGGRFRDSVRVTFVTKPHGDRGEVIFPREAFDEATAAATLAVEAATLEAVHSL